ncbi:hypothetical protein E8E13_002447 [Curvularia kusanoi]|uniref:Protein kinase domain-containing protein n=1 Tax=Curvularia kusanoi TaxID=90978 RepID=A0A9P4T9A3_CURKU|nr:hypothetical protein E8E13_002447 [Curvularia kusanoi]
MAELAIGSVSFFFQAFAGCIQCYELIADACRFNKDYETLMIKMKVEEHRLIDWARSVRLDYTDRRLLLNHMSKGMIMGIMEQQQKLLHSFGKLNEDYEPLAEPLLVELDEEFIIDSDRLLTNGEASTIRFPAADDLINKVRNFNKQLQKPVKKLKWAISGKDKMEVLIGHLVHFNDKLNEALDKAQRDSLREEQLRTQYQIVLLNRTVENLVQIVQSHRQPDRITTPSYPAILNRAETEYGRITGPPIARDPHTQPLAALAQLAAVNMQSEGGIRDITSSFTERIDLNHTADEIQNTKIELGDIQLTQSWEEIEETERTEGIFNDQSVWIEWKVVEPSPGHMNGTNDIIHERITTLAALLREMNRIVQFRAPVCLGYFYDDDNGRFGFVFAKPPTVPSNESPTTLRALLDTEMPSLTDRITLMRLLAETVERLHAVDWLHKGLRSSNILFFKDQNTGAINLADPYISGFEYARPAQRDDMTQRPSDDPAADIYRHPLTQSGASPFLKSFDLYSLGIVLLEIAYWQPIERILGIANLMGAKPKEVSGAKARLLNEAQFSRHVKSHLGLTAESLVWACLKGPEGFGLDESCDEKDAVVAARLQREFGERVVKRLGMMRGL